jgi:DNA-binding GntR family transcriptional regulator
MLPKESKHLEKSKAAYIQNVWSVRRMCRIPFSIENIVVPDTLITELGKETEIPNELYQLYEQAYNETIHKMVEHLRAGKLTHSEATYLSL